MNCFTTFLNLNTQPLWIQGWKQGQESHHSPVHLVCTWSCRCNFFQKCKKNQTRTKDCSFQNSPNNDSFFLQRLLVCSPWSLFLMMSAPRSWTLQWEGYVLQLKNVRIKAALPLEIVLLVLESAALQRNNYNMG
jgi:hypothetical protein